MRELILELIDFNEGISAAKQHVEKHEISPENFDQLAQLDTTANKKYIVWMVRSFINGKLEDEDVSRYAVVAKYDDLVKRRLTDKKNIEEFKTLEELEAEVESKQTFKTKREIKKETKVKGADVIMDTPKVKIWNVKTKEAAQLLGKGTKWCTSAMTNNAFDKYHDDLVSNIYIVVPKGESFSRFGKMCVIAKVGQHIEVWNAADEELPHDIVDQIMKNLGVEI